MPGIVSDNSCELHCIIKNNTKNNKGIIPSKFLKMLRSNLSFGHSCNIKYNFKAYK